MSKLIPVFLLMAGIGLCQELDRWQVLLRLDKDGDGKISSAEYGGGAERFARFDKNKDGFITEDEMKAAGEGEARRGRRGGPDGRRGRRNPTVDLMKAADADKNGEVTSAEWKALVATFANEDGTIDAEKVIAKLAPPKPEGAPEGGAKPEGAPERPEGRRRGRGGPPPADMIKRALDTNRDRTLDGKDFDEMFARLDRDKDGKIVEGELKAERSRRGAGLLARMADADESGDVTEAERIAMVESVRTADGSVDIGALAEMMPMRGGRGGRGGGEGRGGRGGGFGGGGDFMTRMLTRMLDTDEDGKVTVTELEDALKVLDANGDGAIDADEMPKRRRRGGRGGPGGPGGKGGGDRDR